jgi:prolyl-tRNA synthetase
MRWSAAFIPTLREDPAQAEAASHRLLVRAGYIRQLTAGVYSLLPLAFRVRQKLMAIIADEMQAIGGQEFLLPALTPSELWEQSGRWQTLSEIMFRLKDRRGSMLGLGPTHEEVFTSIAGGEIRSYRDLPQMWYQMQTKFRDEARPKSGLLRVREFTMKDAYSFDVDFAGLDVAFDKQYQAYCKIFKRCALDFLPVDASSGAMGGKKSTEFIVATDAGEDHIVRCTSCSYAANLEKAASNVTPHAGEDREATLEEFPTPQVRTIEDLAKFSGGAPADRQIKTLVYMINGSMNLVLMRGDHELNLSKLTEAAGTADIRPAHPDEIQKALNALPGSLGAVGISSKAHAHVKRVIADDCLQGRTNLVTGANRDDFHLRGVSFMRDIQVDLWTDLRTVKAADKCANCGKDLEIFRGLEIGHCFKLGTGYAETLNAKVLNAEGQEVPIVMGSYGIGVERLLAAIVESHHDAAGIKWPVAVAPYSVLISALSMKDAEVTGAAEKIYSELKAAGIDVLYDDRDERAGVKFNDADLIGIPFRITLGKKVSQGIAEVLDRSTGQSSEIQLDQLVTNVVGRCHK